MKRLFFLLAFAGCSALSFAQLKGRVVELDANKKPSGLPNAIVQVKHGEFTVTDTAGNFLLIDAKKGDTLVFNLTGYKTEGVIVKDISKPITVVLSSGVLLNEVEIEYRSSGTEISYLSAIKTEILTERSLMKAACCNLSESFETNPSIDVSFADAVTGTKQIQMLGLSGQYAQITKENMPYLRGLANSFGLSFIPGTWIQSIQLSKGAGSVINGYESFTGQINTELQNPETSDKLHFNAYGSQSGRNEYNLNLKHRLNPKLSVGLLSHVSSNPRIEDHNHDHFADIPTGSQYNFMNKYSFQSKKGFEAQFGGGYLKDTRRGGQYEQLIHDEADTLPYYKIGLDNEKWELYSKTGFVLKRQATSMGLQLSYLNHSQNNFYDKSKYTGLQKTFYANYIFQSYIKTTDNTYKIGASFMDDKVDETFRLYKFNREEQVGGAFVEFAHNTKDKFNMIAGLRADYHNYYGLFFTPRLHLRYAFNESKTVFRLSGGRALRTPNIFSDNMYLMVSSRDWILEPGDLSMPYGLKPETGWNYGLNFTQKFKINYRDAYFTIDAYRTDFTNQVIVDVDNSAQEVLIYNLKGPSFSNTAQFEFNMEPRKRFFMKLAYRYVDTRVNYKKGLLQKPMVSAHRAFINLSYETKDSHWQFDFTTQFNGSKRLPNTQTNPEEFRRADNSPDFYNLLGQITYLTKIKKADFHIYVGVENLLDYKQADAVVDEHNVYSKYFDASMVWGPVYGRMVYAGLRYKIK